MKQDEILSDFINEFNFWDDGTQMDPTGNAQAPSAAYYMPKSSAISQGLVWANSEGHFGMKNMEPSYPGLIYMHVLRSLR